MKQEIQIVNKIIKEAVIHGADSGGSYDQNEHDLIAAINEWLIFKGWHNQYTIESKVDTGDGWSVPQIVLVKDTFSWLENLSV